MSLNTPMYPFARLALTTLAEKKLPPMGIFETHKLSLRCLPWDVDVFGEMNNGRIPTLYDLGRVAYSIRVGLWAALADNKWGLVVAGSTFRFRARITPLQKFELRTRFVGWDHRFFYLEQSMWRGETCCNHGFLRTGVTEKGRLAPVDEVLRALKADGPSPDFPDWARAWIDADALRPWPPNM